MANSPLFSAGTKTSFGRRSIPDCTGAAADCVFLHEEDVSGRMLLRHGSPVSKVIWYRVKVSGRPTFLLAYLDPGGLVADVDLVNE